MEQKQTCVLPALPMEGSSVTVNKRSAASFSAAQTSGSIRTWAGPPGTPSPDCLAYLPPELSEPTQPGPSSSPRTGAARPHGSCWV